MGFGIAGQQAQLARQVLDVVHDEGNTAVEIVEAPRLGQRGLPRLFSKIAGQLPTRDAQQIEILPIQPSGQRGSSENDHANQAVEMVKRHNCPGPEFGK